MAEHGGYRQPAHPAPVSGPGAQSRRTDGGPAQVASAVPDQPYGDAGQQLADQRVAPMAGQGATPPPASQVQPQTVQHPNQYNGPAFNAPTARPNEPVTAGVPIGPGPGPSIQPVTQQPTGQLTSMLQQVSASDTTGVLAQLYQMAQARGV